MFLLPVCGNAFREKPTNFSSNSASSNIDCKIFPCKKTTLDWIQSINRHSFRLTQSFSLLFENIYISVCFFKTTVFFPTIVIVNGHILAKLKKKIKIYHFPKIIRTRLERLFKWLIVLIFTFFLLFLLVVELLSQLISYVT